MKNCSISPSRDMQRWKKLIKQKYGGGEVGGSEHYSLIGKEGSGRN